MLIYKNENKIVTLTNQKQQRLVRDFILKRLIKGVISNDKIFDKNIY